MKIFSSVCMYGKAVMAEIGLGHQYNINSDDGGSIFL